FAAIDRARPSIANANAYNACAYPDIPTSHYLAHANAHTRIDRTDGAFAAFLDRDGAAFRKNGRLRPPLHHKYRVEIDRGLDCPHERDGNRRSREDDRAHARPQAIPQTHRRERAI